MYVKQKISINALYEADASCYELTSLTQDPKQLLYRPPDIRGPMGDPVRRIESSGRSLRNCGIERNSQELLEGEQPNGLCWLAVRNQRTTGCCNAAELCASSTEARVVRRKQDFLRHSVWVGGDGSCPLPVVALQLLVCDRMSHAR